MSDDTVDGLHHTEPQHWGLVVREMYRLFNSYTHNSGYLYIHMTGKNILTAEQTRIIKKGGEPYSDEEMRSSLEQQKKMYPTMKNDLFVMRLDTGKELMPQLIATYPSIQNFVSFSEFRQYLVSERELMRDLTDGQKSNLPASLQHHQEDAHAPRLHGRRHTQQDHDTWQNRLDRSGISLVHPGQGEKAYFEHNPYLEKTRLATVDGALHEKFKRASNIPDHLVMVQQNFHEACNNGHRGFVQYYKPLISDFSHYRSFPTIGEAYEHVTMERRAPGTFIMMMLDTQKPLGEQLRNGPYISPRQAIHKPVIAPIYGQIDVSHKPFTHHDEWLNRPEPGSWR